MEDDNAAGMSAAESSRLRSARSGRYRWAWIVFGLIGLAALVFFHLNGSRQYLLATNHADPLKHVFAFGAIMVWFGKLYRRGIERGLICSCLILAGIALEFVQSEWWRYDAVEYGDMAADATGAFLGWMMLKMPSGDMIKTWIARQ